ncbi:MAG: nitroreductase family protein [Lactimicrobium sp.]|jgi:nitroreductase|uniref:nitroreductase family protein n=1 Tax=Lactimicrobium sp. TaxID=2563780 RepID=UPI002F35FAE1
MKSSHTEICLDLIKNRRSIRRFQKTPVTSHQLALLQEAAELAPSARNEQPWFFCAIENQEIIHQIEQLAEPAGNCYNAPLLLCAFADKKALEPVKDTVFALANIMYTCEAIGLGSCYINFVSDVFNCPAYDKLAGALGVPEGYFAVGALAIGVPAEEKPVPTDRKKNIFSIVQEDAQ